MVFTNYKTGLCKYLLTTQKNLYGEKNKNEDRNKRPNIVFF